MNVNILIGIILIVIVCLIFWLVNKNKKEMTNEYIKKGNSVIKFIAWEVLYFIVAGIYASIYKRAITVPNSYDYTPFIWIFLSLVIFTTFISIKFKFSKISIVLLNFVMIFVFLILFPFFGELANYLLDFII